MDSALTRLDHPTSILPLRLTLKERDIEDAERHLYDVSPPKSASWGKHWSSGDVRTIATCDDTIYIVLDWLIASGIGGEGWH